MFLEKLNNSIYTYEKKSKKCKENLSGSNEKCLLLGIAK